MVDEDVTLSLAMMTGAGKENLELVRFLDHEKVPTIGMAHECQRVLELITVRVERQGCLGCGHTAFMLRVMEKERLLFSDRRPKRVGCICSRQ